jgi:hypothetical protein
MPKRFRQFLTAHEVRTAREMGWAELENGDLLEAAENAGFEVMVTADKNLSYQQNLAGRKLALVVVSTNDWNLLSKNPAPVAAVDRPGTTGPSVHRADFPARCATPAPGRSRESSHRECRLPCPALPDPSSSAGAGRSDPRRSPSGPPDGSGANF